MKRFTLLLVLVFSGLAHAGQEQPLTIPECADLAGRFHANPFALSMSDLDNLRLCAAMLMQARQDEERTKREDRAIMRNFNLKDAE